MYRSPTGNFTSFLSNLEMILQKLLNQKCNVIICVDININCLNDMKRTTTKCHIKFL